MTDEVRLVDVELLTANIAQIAKKCARSDAQKALVGRILLVIDNMPTVEAEPDKGWISVKDRLPPYGERVLVVNEAHEAKCAYTMYDCGVTIIDPHLNFTFWGHKVTHWMPLPEPPKEDKDG